MSDGCPHRVLVPCKGGSAPHVAEAVDADVLAVGGHRYVGWGAWRAQEAHISDLIIVANELAGQGQLNCRVLQRSNRVRQLVARTGRPGSACSRVLWCSTDSRAAEIVKGED